MKETDLPLIEWDGEYARYRRTYSEVYRNLQRGLSYPYVAETEADGLVGQVFLTDKGPNPNYSANAKYFFLSSFRVKEPFRNRGLGTQLLRICELTARDKGIRQIYLNCAVDNTNGLAFYEKHGFVKHRRESNIWTFINEKGNVVSEPNESWLMVYQVGA